MRTATALRWPSDRTTVVVADEGNTQSRSALAAVRALAAANIDPVVTTTGPPSLASTSRHCRKTLDVPKGCGPGFGDAVARALDDPHCLTVLPTSDVALLALGWAGAELLNKKLLGERARAVGMLTPPERTFPSMAELVEEAATLRFPLVVKPLTRTPDAHGSAIRVQNAAELRAAPQSEGQILVQPFIDGPMSAVAGVVTAGAFVAIVHQRYLRTWPRDCGVASAALTTKPDLGREEALLQLLSGYDGIFQAQFVGPYLVDLNPRVYGSLPLAVRAGANLPALWCAVLAGAGPKAVRAREGVTYRWTEGDVRHVRSAVARGDMTVADAVRALRPRHHVAHSVGAVDDPKPLLVRTTHLVRKLT